MIVLDEQLKNAGLVEQIEQWYRGRVGYITALRPGTVIKDEAIPSLLHQVNDSTFVTINTIDFWGRIAAERSYCIVCFPLPDDRIDEISDLLQRLFRVSAFSTKRARRGKVALVSHGQVQYYQVHDPRVHILEWSAS